MNELPETCVNIEAEQKLLGNILASNDAQRVNQFLRVSTIVTEDDFFDGLHKSIYSEIKKSVAAGEVSSPVMISQRFDEEQRKYIMRLFASVISFSSTQDYAIAVSDASSRRKLLEISANINKSVLDYDSKPQTIASSVNQDISKIYTTGKSSTSLVEAMHEFSEDSLKPQKITSTGINSVDKALNGGLQAGRMYGISARMKKGKSAMMGTFAYNAAMAGKRIAYITLEMSKVELASRFMSRAVLMSPDGLRKNQVKTKQAIELLGNFKLDIFDFKRINLDRLLLELSRIGYSKKYDGVVVDYIQLVGGRAKNQSQADHYDDVAQALAETAKEHNIWVLTAAQLNRDGEVRGSDGLLNACDAAFSLDSEMYGTPDGGYTIEAWMEMTVMRYAGWNDVGSKEKPALRLNKNGPFFEEW